MHRRLITVVWPCTLCLHPATALQYFVFVCVCVGGGGCMVLLFYVHVKQLRSWTNGSLFFCVFFFESRPRWKHSKTENRIFLAHSICHIIDNDIQRNTKSFPAADSVFNICSTGQVR